MKCNSAHMLEQAARAMDHMRDLGAYASSLEELARHIRQVRASEVTLDQFADFYMIRPEAGAQEHKS